MTDPCSLWYCSYRNDKVSIAAINLRKSWIQLTKSKTDSGSDVDRVKSLEGMNRILEQKDTQEGEISHLAVLEKLQGMMLSTQDIIKSKIGVVVSKLRKSRYASLRYYSIVFMSYS